MRTSPCCSPLRKDQRKSRVHAKGLKETRLLERRHMSRMALQESNLLSATLHPISRQMVQALVQFHPTILVFRRGLHGVKSGEAQDKRLP